MDIRGVIFFKPYHYIRGFFTVIIINIDFHLPDNKPTSFSVEFLERIFTIRS